MMKTPVSMFKKLYKVIEIEFIEAKLDFKEKAME